MKRKLEYRWMLWCGIWAVVTLLAACDHLAKPSSSGRPYEVLVVVGDSLWQRPAGRALFDVLDTDIPGLPQPERSFRISQTDPQRFNQVLNIFRNIIKVDIAPNQYTQTKMKFTRDVYAQPQVVLTIQSPNEKDFAAFVQKNAQSIIDFLVKMEMNRQINELEKKHSEVVLYLADSIFSCQFWAPVEIKSYKKGKDFFWASTNTATGDQNFVIYSYPYTDKNTFTKEYFIHKRDSVMKANIPGAKEGMYMSTDSITVDVRPIDVHGDYTMEARGLWRMKGDFMGGPFVSHTRLDKANQRIITAEIFVYSPDKLKRNLVRMLEASLYTLKLPAEKVQGEIPMGNVAREEQTNK